MSKITKIASIGLLAATLAACGNNPSAPSSEAPSVSNSAAADASVAPVVEPTEQNMPGVYTGTLPCGDCKGVITKLELSADGTYRLNEAYDGKIGDGSVLDSSGRWTADFAAKRLTLDPTEQTWEDRSFDVLSAGHIRPLDAAGNAYSTDGDNDLRVGN